MAVGLIGGESVGLIISYKHGLGSTLLLCPFVHSPRIFSDFGTMNASSVQGSLKNKLGMPRSDAADLV